MAPTVNSPEFLQRMRETMDPVRYARLFLAEFSEIADVFLSLDEVERATDRGVRERLPESFPSGTAFVAFADPAMHGSDLFTLSVVAVTGKGADRRYAQCVLHVAPKDRGGNVTETAVVSCVQVLRRFGLSKVWGDRATGGAIKDAFKRHGVSYEYPHVRRDERGVDREMDKRQVYADRSKLYMEFSPIIRSGTYRILDVPELRRELTNLDQSGERVEPGPMHDDRAIVTAGAVVVASQEGARPKPMFVAVQPGGGSSGSRGGGADYAVRQVQRALHGRGGAAGGWANPAERGW